MNLRHRGVSALPRGTVVTQHTLHATVEVIRAGYPNDPVRPGFMGVGAVLVGAFQWVRA
jgi:hypothetical protein